MTFTNDQVDDDHKKENNGSSDDASQRLHSFRYSNILRSGKQQPATAVVKKPSTKTNSTLSLHINAYENSNEASGGDSNDKFRFGRSRNSKTFNKIRNSVKQYFGKSSSLTILFEIPRQQDDPLNSTPEIMEFKASQKLLNPNKVEADISEENEPK
uniref:Uncharacterized protein n=1 Tax=Panagrolaimus sp. ES5 TaxID=591445 RepID=A0AC34G538_9BILA